MTGALMLAAALCLVVAGWMSSPALGLIATGGALWWAATRIEGRGP